MRPFRLLLAERDLAGRMRFSGQRDLLIDNVLVIESKPAGDPNAILGTEGERIIESDQAIRKRTARLQRSVPTAASRVRSILRHSVVRLGSPALYLRLGPRFQVRP
jgi:hypothetical protein